MRIANEVWLASAADGSVDRAIARDRTPRPSRPPESELQGAQHTCRQYHQRRVESAPPFGPTPPSNSFSTPPSTAHRPRPTARRDRHFLPGRVHASNGLVPRTRRLARTDDNCAAFTRAATLGATAHTRKGLKVPCSAAELPAREILVSSRLDSAEC